MNDLFGIEKVRMDELESSDFDFFKRGDFLNTDNANVIEPYYARLYDTPYHVPFYHCLPELNGVVNDRKFRFRLVEIDGDTVFFAYKVIQILTTRQIRVFDLPVSLNGDNKNVTKVLLCLKGKEFVRFCFADFINHPLLDKTKADRLVEYDNYYNTRAYYNGLSPREKRKKRIASMEKDVYFKCVVTSKITISEATDIRKSFNDYLLRTGHRISAADDTEFHNFVTKGQANTIVVALWYKEKMVHISSLLVYPSRRVAYSLYSFSIHGDVDEETKRFLGHNMTHKVMYLTFKYLPDIDIVYVLGCMPTEHRLLQHKDMTCDGKIEYYII